MVSQEGIRDAAMKTVILSEIRRDFPEKAKKDPEPFSLTQSNSAEYD